jgi:hypothetical protein
VFLRSHVPTMGTCSSCSTVNWLFSDEEQASWCCGKASKSGRKSDSLYLESRTGWDPCSPLDVHPPARRPPSCAHLRPGSSATSIFMPATRATSNDAPLRSHGAARPLPSSLAGECSGVLASSPSGPAEPARMRSVRIAAIPGEGVTIMDGRLSARFMTTAVVAPATTVNDTPDYAGADVL